MFQWLKKIRANPRVPDGQRVYAIGDLHGEAGLFQQLLGFIEEDCSRRGPAATTLILLGDFIDRGPDAAALLRTLAAVDDPQLIILKGNHESAFVECYRGDTDALPFWLEFGGRATLTGFGISVHDLFIDDDALSERMRAHIDPALVAWVDALPLSWSLGDYFFTHAGIRPGVHLENQTADDLMWIREPFLSDGSDHGKIIVHGHTVMADPPDLDGNRIGLDTGAHENGLLVALGIEGDQRWLLKATKSISYEIGIFPVAA